MSKFPPISVNIPTEIKNYKILFPENFSELNISLEKQINGRKAIYITDKNIIEKSPFFTEEKFSPTKNSEEILVLTPGEEYKTWKSIEKILDHGFKNSCDRSSVIVAIGGGVVGDMTGFASAIFMRGVPFIQLPTTLLAMVDSSIGGKTGIDTPHGKNLIGAFYQPEAVFCCNKFLETLEPIEIQNGFAEMVKHAIVNSPEHFENLRLLTENFSGMIDSGYLPLRFSKFRNDEGEKFLEKVFSLVPESIAIKQNIVQQDEKERGIRGFLNLGHTYGHAIELLSDFSIPHGCAVAKGIIMACRESEKRKIFLEENITEKIIEIFEDFGMDISPRFEEEKIFAAMEHDKKKKNGRIRIILPKKIGEVEYQDL